MGRLGMGEQEPGSQHQVNLKGKGVKGAGIGCRMAWLLSSRIKYCGEETNNSTAWANGPVLTNPGGHLPLFKKKELATFAIQ